MASDQELSQALLDQLDQQLDEDLSVSDLLLVSSSLKECYDTLAPKMAKVHMLDGPVPIFAKRWTVDVGPLPRMIRQPLYRPTIVPDSASGLILNIAYANSHGRHAYFQIGANLNNEDWIYSVQAEDIALNNNLVNSPELLSGHAVISLFANNPGVGEHEHTWTNLGQFENTLMVPFNDKGYIELEMGRGAEQPLILSMGVWCVGYLES